MSVVKLLTFLEFLCLFLLARSESCTPPNTEIGECILLKSCPSLLEQLAKTADSAELIRKSICGVEGVDAKVCCPTTLTSTSSTINKNSPVDNGNQEKKKNNKHLLPDRRICGLQHFDDYGHSTNDTGINESPWLARLGYKDLHVDDNKLIYGCAGSLINNRYVLTAAICVTDRDLLLKIIQLGEYHVHNQTDCVKDDSIVEECSDPVKNYQFEKVIVHSGFSTRGRSHTNDIALIRLKEKVEYSDYIRPICLPYPNTTLANVGDVLTQSGWGYLNLEDGEAIVKKRVLSTLISNEECSEAVNHLPNFKLTDKYLCTRVVENSTQLSCQGDSGTPVTFSHRLQWHQEGIVSFRLELCGHKFPDVNTRVSQYLEWIEENIEP